MTKEEAIEYLKGRLEDIPALARLRYNNTKYPLWISTVRGVVEKVFGKGSYEYERLAQVYRIVGSYEETRQNSYISNLRRRDIDISSIIQTWEATGGESHGEGHVKPSVPLDLKASWADISKQFGTTRMGFGKRIRFVADPFKRKIVFRDIEQAFVLASLGCSKPAVILAGSVIEELLRLYLEHKGVSPVSNTFDGYIKTCEQHGLLKESVSRLSHSVRQFRNLVHLSGEEDKTYTLSKAAAMGAVASIFTVVNDF